jgi:hypothetical protein
MRRFLRIDQNDVNINYVGILSQLCFYICTRARDIRRDSLVVFLASVLGDIGKPIELATVWRILIIEMRTVVSRC